MARSTHGIKLMLGDGSSNYTTIGGITNLAGPNIQVNMIDATDLDSEYKTRVAGDIDNGDATLSINFDPADTSHASLRTELEGRDSANYSATWADYGTSTSAISSVDTGTDVVTTGAAHGLLTGQPVQFSTSGTLPAGLATSTTYYVNVASDTTFTAHTTNAAAVAGTGAVDITDTGTGSHTVNKPSRWDFSGHVSGYQPTAPVDDKLTADITINITGSITS